LSSAVSLHLAPLMFTNYLSALVPTLELLKRLVNLIELAFVQLEDPVTSPLNIFPFPDQ
jgi:hypothetical protein